MNIDYIEKELELIISNINLFNDDVSYRIDDLFSIINLNCEYFDIEEVEITEIVASTWAFFEQLVFDKNEDIISEIYDFMIVGFMNFWKSERYFNQNDINAIEKDNSCKKIKLSSYITNNYINSCLISLVRAYFGMDFKAINDFESEFIMNILVNRHFKNYENKKRIIPINNMKYHRS